MQKRRLKDIPLESIIKLYQATGSIRKAASYLDVSHPALLKFLRRRGVDLTTIKKTTKVSEIKPSINIVSRVSCFEKWLRENSGIELPRSPKRLAKLSGCSQSSINNWFAYRRKTIKEKLKDVPNLRKLDVYFTDSEGYEHHGSEIANYAFIIDPYKLKVWIVIRLENETSLDPNKYFHRIPVDDIDEFRNKLIGIEHLHD